MVENPRFALPAMPNQQGNTDSHPDLVAEDIPPLQRSPQADGPPVTPAIEVKDQVEFTRKMFAKPVEGDPFQEPIVTDEADNAVPPLKPVNGPPEKLDVGVRESIFVARCRVRCKSLAD